MAFPNAVISQFDPQFAPLALKACALARNIRKREALRNDWLNNRATRRGIEAGVSSGRYVWGSLAEMKLELEKVSKKLNW